LAERVETAEKRKRKKKSRMTTGASGLTFSVMRDSGWFETVVGTS
jgi:hypothetical protein